MVRGGLALAALAASRFGLIGCTTRALAGAREDPSQTAHDAPGFDAIIVRSNAHDASSAASHDAGIRRFATVQAALDAAPHAATRPFRILVTPGRWHEKLVIDKPFIHLIGADRDDSVLTHDTAAGHQRPDGEPWGTWGCASLRVRAPDFAAINLTVENAFDYLGHLREPKLETIGPNGAQAVALMLGTGSDRALVQDATLLGHQDTLFVDAGRSSFRGCLIAGSVDFIFGAGDATFLACELRSRYRPGKPRQGYIAAPSTLASQPFGLTFMDCRLTREADVPAQSVALGRPWRPTRQFADGRYGDPGVIGAAAFLRCWMDEHVAAEGWDEMSYSARDGSRVAFDPAQARLFE